MKLMIITGSPKTEGICHSFVEIAKETAMACDACVEIIRLADMGLTPCEMCGDGWGICYREHICKHGAKDGFNNLLEKIRDTDAFIFVTPVYWGEPSEAFKNFLDKLRRTQGTKVWDAREDQVTYLNGKPIIVVASAGGGGGGTGSTFEYIERAITHMEGKPWVFGGIFDYIAVNRWNQEYKRQTLKEAVKEMTRLWTSGLIEKNLHMWYKSGSKSM